jgi:hypothetical protein
VSVYYEEYPAVDSFASIAFFAVFIIFIAINLIGVGEVKGT